MLSFWYFVPKSGVAFIFISIILITVWNGYRDILIHPYTWIFSAEAILFIICFIIANRESNLKRKKHG